MLRVLHVVLCLAHPPPPCALRLAHAAVDGHACNRPWDGPSSAKNPWGPAGRLTLTSWTEIGLAACGEYTARDVFSQELLPANASGFVANVTGDNATLVLVQRKVARPQPRV